MSIGEEKWGRRPKNREPLRERTKKMAFKTLNWPNGEWVKEEGKCSFSAPLYIFIKWFDRYI